MKCSFAYVLSGSSISTKSTTFPSISSSFLCSNRLKRTKNQHNFSSFSLTKKKQYLSTNKSILQATVYSNVLHIIELSILGLTAIQLSANPTKIQLKSSSKSRSSLSLKDYKLLDKQLSLLEELVTQQMKLKETKIQDPLIYEMVKTSRIKAKADDFTRKILERNQFHQKFVQTFPEIVKDRNPSFLWIGCSDARVQPDQIFQSIENTQFDSEEHFNEEQIGKLRQMLNYNEFYVTTNNANMFIHSDLSVNCVLERAVNEYKIDTLIVCGHYGCGSVKAAMSQLQYGVMDYTMKYLRDIRRKYSYELDLYEDADMKFRRFCELNVIEQVKNVAASGIVQKAWIKGRRVRVYGLIFDVNSGLVKDLHCMLDKESDIDAAYRTPFIV